MDPLNATPMTPPSSNVANPLAFSPTVTPRRTRRTSSNSLPSRHRPTLSRETTSTRCNPRRPDYASPRSSYSNARTPDECLDLYYRSCNIFRPPHASDTRPSTSYHAVQTPKSTSPSRHDSAVSCSDLKERSSRSSGPLLPTTIVAMTESKPEQEPDPPTGDQEQGQEQEHGLAPTVLDWTLPETRMRQHAQIDRDSKGIRRLWRKLSSDLSCFGGGGIDKRMLSFYGEGDSDDDDKRSVRRYRVNSSR